ncbi:hypothetical protein KC322_g11361 [Hortaea werneckii]|nr:hypothetical protein KC322_g11361 [Hortaea werneckii]
MTALQEMGSDEDLFRFLGCRIPEHLRGQPETVPRPAPAALPASATEKRGGGAAHLRLSDEIRLSTQSRENPRRSREQSSGSQRAVPSTPPPLNRSMSFFDVGGLLEEDNSNSRPGTRSGDTTFSESGCSGTMVQDFAPTHRLQSTRGSQAFLADIGGIMNAGDGTAYEARQWRGGSSLLRQGHAPTGVLGPMLERRETQQSLQDAGGLLGQINSRVSSEDDSFLMSLPGHEGSPKWPPSVGKIEQETADHGSDVRVFATTHSNAQRSPQQKMEMTRPLASSQVREAQRPEDMNICDPGGLLTK